MLEGLGGEEEEEVAKSRDLMTLVIARRYIKSVPVIPEVKRNALTLP